MSFFPKFLQFILLIRDHVTICLWCLQVNIKDRRSCWLLQDMWKEEPAWTGARWPPPASWDWILWGRWWKETGSRSCQEPASTWGSGGPDLMPRSSSTLILLMPQLWDVCKIPVWWWFTKIAAGCSTTVWSIMIVKQVFHCKTLQIVFKS